MKQGFLYIISGADRYFRDAGESVASLRRHNPGSHATLLSDALPASRPQLGALFDSVVTPPLERTTGRNVTPHVQATTYRVRNIYRRTPYERTCHVDSDTYFLGDFQPLFDLLDHFDMAMTLAPSDTTPLRIAGRELTGCPLYNCGMMMFKKGEMTEQLFERWLYWQEQSLDDPESLGNDQVTFMRALLEVPARVCVVQSNWNARTGGHERFRGPVRLIHGRHANMTRVADEINRAASELRAWIPRVELCVYDRMTLAHHIRYCIKTTRVLGRAALRRIAR